MEHKFNNEAIDPTIQLERDRFINWLRIGLAQEAQGNFAEWDIAAIRKTIISRLAEINSQKSVP